MPLFVLRSYVAPRRSTLLTPSPAVPVAVADEMVLRPVLALVRTSWRPAAHWPSSLATTPARPAPEAPVAGLV